MPSMLDDLLNPTSLPDKTERVALIQTHISSVFLGDRFVYKVKKPVNFGFLDFSTLEKRYYYCNQEILLNRRLSRDVYLGVLPIIYDGKNHRIGKGEGRVVDYAVRMKRFPEEKLMKSVFLRGELRDQHLEEIAGILANFHQNAEYSSDINKFGEPEMFAINTDENFAQTEKYVGLTIRQKDFDDLKRWTSHFYNLNKNLFRKRITAKKIRDCHGDLHMEHVCLTEGIPIFDCIEFNDRFRYTDSIADIAFLLMDLEYHGGERFSKTLWDFYRDMTGEADAVSLLAFYKVYRAFVRGKVNSFRVDDRDIGIETKDQAVETARKYFELARSYTE